MKRKNQLTGYKEVAVIAAFVLCLTGCLRGQTQPKDQPPPKEQPMIDVADFNVEGVYLKAFLVAYADFMQIKDLPQSKKVIQNYNLGFSEDKGNYYVYFHPKESEERKKDGPLVIDSENEFGEDMRYTIGKKDFTVKQRGYYR